MGSNYLRKFSESGHVSPRVDFIDFLSGVGNYYKFLNYEYWSIFLLIVLCLISFGFMGIDLR